MTSFVALNRQMLREYILSYTQMHTSWKCNKKGVRVKGKSPCLCKKLDSHRYRYAPEIPIYSSPRQIWA